MKMSVYSAGCVYEYPLCRMVQVWNIGSVSPVIDSSLKFSFLVNRVGNLAIIHTQMMKGNVYPCT